MLAGMIARPRSDFRAHEFWRDEGGDAGAEILAIRATVLGAVRDARAAEIFAMRDVAHFFRDDAVPGEFVLRDALAVAAFAESSGRGTGWHEAIRGDEAVVLRTNRARGGLREAPRGDPARAQGRQSPREVDGGGWIGVGSRGVVDADRLFSCGRIERDFPERDAEGREILRRRIGFARAEDRAGCDSLGGR